MNGALVYERMKAILFDEENIDSSDLELEIVPQQLFPHNEHSGIIQDGRCIGMSKEALVGAYLHAKSIFFASRSTFLLHAPTVQCTIKSSGIVHPRLTTGLTPGHSGARIAQCLPG